MHKRGVRALSRSPRYHLLSVLLPGEERSGHEQAVQAPEVQPPKGGQAGQEVEQGGLGDAAARQGQALHLRT